MSEVRTSVAAIIPCHNAERTLGATLASAVAEEGITEIVVVDDGSSDESRSVAQRFSPRVRVLSGPNCGVSAARNRGISEISADWVVFLDADDSLLPGTIAKRLDAALATNADVIICEWEELIDDGAGRTSIGKHRTVDWPALDADAELAIATRVWATTAAIMYRRQVVERIGGFRTDLPIIQDARFLFDAAHAGASFARSAHVGAHYRLLPGSLSRRNPARFWQDVLRNGLQIETIWRAAGTLSPQRLLAIRDICDVAGRGLLAACDPSFFDAAENLHRIGQGRSLFMKVTVPMAKVCGLGPTRAVMAALGRI